MQTILKSAPPALATALLCLLAFSSTALAQSSSTPKPDPMADMPGMKMDPQPATQPVQTQMPGMNMGPSAADPFIQSILEHSTSGTSAEPSSTPMNMLMSQRKGWMLMLHGVGFVNEQQQSGPRGADKLFSTNWIMPMAQRQFGRSTLTLRAMLSLEPATVTGRYYPLLFQQGETAYGNPIVDGQHPHNFFMELAALYDVKLGEHGLLSFYAAPAGDPAIGPTAFPHRASASENPVAALGHHQMDSTHIAFNVLTAGLTYRIARIEFSGFHGQEPNEHRWQLYSSSNGVAIDSYSTRITVNPTRNWSGQYSIARIVSPEALYQHDDQQRQTASAMYSRTLARGNWDSTAVWGRTRSLADNGKQNSYLLESTLHFADKNAVWTRIENASRTNELLLRPGTPLPPGFQERALAHVQAYSFGYDRDMYAKRHVSFAPGLQLTTFNTPTSLQPLYGAHPIGVEMFVRIRIR